MPKLGIHNQSPQTSLKQWCSSENHPTFSLKNNTETGSGIADYADVVGIFCLASNGKFRKGSVQNLGKKNLFKLKSMKTSLKKSNKGGFTHKNTFEIEYLARNKN